jgi:hypothetical protein
MEIPPGILSWGLASPTPSPLRWRVKSLADYLLPIWRGRASCGSVSKKEETAGISLVILARVSDLKEESRESELPLMLHQSLSQDRGLACEWGETESVMLLPYLDPLAPILDVEKVRCATTSPHTVTQIEILTHRE